MNTVINVYSLVDITATGDLSGNYNKTREQQRNWETAQQLVNLRFAVQIRAIPANPKLVDVSQHEFGKIYTGTHRCWKFIFSVDFNSNSIKNHGNLINLLQFDFDHVPVNTGLDETASFPNTLFYTSGDCANVYFRVLSKKE